MALTDQEVEFLLAARASGVSLERFCMIGRQSLRIDPGSLRRLLHQAGIVLSLEQTAELYVEQQRFSEPLLRLLGANEIDSVDASNYEQATLVHDMNEPIPVHLKNRYTAVLDGGSLEHVFNFPRAIANCMEMVAVGGHFLAVTPANNLMGHGFYQFSPELFFRVFTPENGFVIQRVIAFEALPGAAWYEVMDPARAAGRVKLANRRPTYLFVQAQKTAHVPVLSVTPQQSDYAAKWSGSKERKQRFKIKLPLAARLFVRELRSRFLSPFDPRFFRKVERG
jgi:hypothetical protein